MESKQNPHNYAQLQHLPYLTQGHEYATQP